MRVLPGLARLVFAHAIAVVVVLPAAAIGCSSKGESDLPVTASPAHASMFGHVDVTLEGDFAKLGVLKSVRVAGLAALNVTATSNRVTVRIQGAPSPGPASIDLVGASGSASNRTAFAYDPPARGVPAHWIAFGASLTQGIQSGGLDAHGQLAGWAAQLAKAAGVFQAPPLVVDGAVPPLEPKDFVGNCGATMDVGKIGNALFAAITDADAHQLDLRRARQDASLATRNYAIGGAKLADVIASPSGFQRILARIAELPDGDPHEYTSPVTLSQLERIVHEDADVGVSGDLLANDSDPAVTQSDDIHLELMTDVATVKSELETIMSALGKLHGDYFIANLVDLAAVPNVSDVRTRRFAAGTETQASFDAKLASVRSVIDAYNAALSAAMDPHPNLHIVDLASGTKVALAGVKVGSETLTGAKFGGLVSLDHLHFTDTGYALVANQFVNAIDIIKGWNIPEVNVEAVHKTDALSPSALDAAGVHCGAN